VTLSVSGSVPGRAIAIDGYYDSSERMRVRIVAPGGTVIGPIALGAEDAPYPGVSTTNGAVYVANDSLPTGRRNVYVEINALLASQSMNGTWTITFLADRLGATNGLVDLWRYYASSGLVANFVAGNQPTRELITEPGNAADVLTVGAFVSRASWTACSGVVSSFSGTPAPGNLSTFSSPGPTRDGRQKPDLVAPGEAIVSTTSFDVAVVCPTSGAASAYADDGMNHTAMRGTSMAAPHVAGAVALLLEKRGALTPAEVKAYLTAHARHDAFTGAAVGNDWGAGKLDLGDLVDPTVSWVGQPPADGVDVGGTLTLGWSARDSLGSIAGVDLLLSRTGPDGAFDTLASAVANTGAYAWVVSGPATPIGQAYLRVVVHDTNSNSGSAESASGFTIRGPLSVDVANAATFSLGAVRPNPARGPLRVAFTLAHAAHVRLLIDDVAGRRVATLASGLLAAGQHEVSWDPTRRGEPMRPGLYFLAYETPVGRFTRRIVVTR
jgi:subtilisin family serine protease